ncbi:hypothetical protein BDN71DRAFT_1501611 [Pleurotus eryngii]|uniref:Alkaline phosphatase n=1 Tax=Pleurotus eryngii TaxID=5323 RepID=A0A9P6DKK5_PLEER|nr:hypothetical protein BDN71DRAFT_1501611 [Pleurotus eryngii]
MRNLLPVFIALVVSSHATLLLDRNLAYRSPFIDHPEHGLVIKSIHTRHVQHSTRQIIDATPFKDEHYPNFFNPFVWNDGLIFTHSVASGDPFDTSVLLWTRAVPASSAGAFPDQSVPVCVSFKFSMSNTLSPVVDLGEAFTSYDVDFTVKVEATGLQPDTKYFFQFSHCTNAESISPVGATMTFASPDAPADQLVDFSLMLNYCVLLIGVCDISMHMALPPRTPPQVYLFTWETTEWVGVTQLLARQLATIHDYRQRFQQYRTDVNLSLAHQSAPWITTWDDHEVANNAWKAETSDSNDTAAGCSFSPSGACFTVRKLAAIRSGSPFVRLIPIIYRFSANSTVRVVSNEIPRPATPLSTIDTVRFNTDAWDGYRVNRARILDHLYNNEINNTVILAGDSHANRVLDLARPDDTTTYNQITGDGAIGVEFAGTVVTSTSSLRANIAPAAADVISRQFG